MLRIYAFQIAVGKYFNFTFMFSGRFIGVLRKKSLRSIERNFAPLWLSEMVLLMRSFVLISVDAGEVASSGYSSLSPPTVRRTRYFSVLRGRWSQTKLSFVTLRFVGTSDRGINWIVLEVSLYVIYLQLTCPIRLSKLGPILLCVYHSTMCPLSHVHQLFHCKYVVLLVKKISWEYP